MTLHTTCLSLAMLSCLAGCLSQDRLAPADIRPLPYSVSNSNGPVPVPGLRQALAASTSAPVRVLVVHGMKTHESGYSDRMQKEIAKTLGLKNPADGTSTSTLVRGYDITVLSGEQPLAAQPQVRSDGSSARTTVSLPASTLIRRAWVDDQSRERLVFFELLWAPLRDRVKESYLSCFESRSVDPQRCTPPAAARNTDRRSWVNGAIKDSILVDGLADATIVLGPVGDVLRDDVELAFCHVMMDVLAARNFGLERRTQRCDFAAYVDPSARAEANIELEKSQFVVMTHSLGSFFVMDAQRRAVMGEPGATGQDISPSSAAATPDPDAAARRDALLHLLFDSVVFMRANQISLLELARLRAICWPAPGTGRCPNAKLVDGDAPTTGPSGFNPMTFYVAFNDIDDLLGFELPPYLAETGEFGTLVNVSVRNPAFKLPFVFTHPGHAHNRSDENPAVIRAMVEGLSLPRNDARP